MCSYHISYIFFLCIYCMTHGYLLIFFAFTLLFVEMRENCVCVCECVPWFSSTRFSSRPPAWLVKFVLKSVCYASFLQQSVKEQIVLSVRSLCSLPSIVYEVKVCLFSVVLCYSVCVIVNPLCYASFQ